MSRNTKSRKNVQRRSALSFAGADDSIDHYIDNIIQSDHCKNVAEIEKSDAACIQNVLNDFDKMIMEQKASKAGNATKKKPKQPKEKSAIKDSTTSTSEGTFSNMHYDMLEPKTKVQTKKKSSTKQTPKTVEETSSRELQCNTDDAKRAVQKTPEPSVKEIAAKESVKKVNKKDVKNTIDTNLLTSTPQKKLFETVGGETAKSEKSTVNKKKQKMTDSENTSKKHVKRQIKRQRKRTLKEKPKDMERCQDEDNTKVSNKNDNLKVEEPKNVLEENVETKLYKDMMKCNVEDEKCKLKIVKKLKDLKSFIDKSPKCAISNTSSKPLKDNMECTKNQCKKGAKNSRTYEEGLLQAKKQSEERKEFRKSKKAAKAMAKLSHEISAVKRKMECIKNDLESRESLDSSSDYSDESSYSSYSSYSSSFSSSSHSSDCSCSYCDYYTSDEYTEYTCGSSDSSTYSANSETRSKGSKNKSSH
ncbi:uncharacterized protein LOC126858581 isoform X2 [Cataglyphis hispanica]|uniref:uncharacterized protein LOC126858581 isoform X2 n=1 Tax=Cataglyphis hispanica TaxID=1086592 RepID=UPI0021803305|nr:uncharacterized protein LOC126858581 isoform X2 [Cataglyphis hispanica]